MNDDLTPPIKWHGGKHYLARRIIELMPPRQSRENPDGWCHYVEPFAGGLSVLLANDPEGISEVVNDLNRALTEFWEVLRLDDEFQDFRRMCEATPFSEVCYRQGQFCCDLAEAEATCGALVHTANARAYRAWGFFVACRQSLAGRMDAFAPLSRNRTRRGMNEQASAWLGAVDGLQAVHERMARVVVLNHDALKVIKQQDGPRTLFYLDPPYCHDTRSAPQVYAREMTPWQHARLLVLLSKVEGRFLLSGYANKLYLLAERKYGWRRHGFDLPNNAASGEAKRRMTECIWTNY